MSWRGGRPASCWEAREASAIIPVEAESTSDGVFLATHTTIPITQRDQVHNARGGIVVDEQALLRAVQEQPADQPVIPILGKSGTGKSHLVRWLRTHLDTNASTRLIFVPKHRMSLRGVLELILEHATGDRADELRAKVARAVDAAADEKTAQLKMRNALAVNIETRGNRHSGTAEEIELRAYLASPGGLPALFGDDVFRSRLLDAQGPIARLVREKLAGKGSEDKDDAFGFTAEDLNLSVDDVKRAGQAARDVAGALTSDPSLRELAAAMTNEQLGPSVSEVFGIGGDDLKQILTDVRADMYKEGLELLVLIEDFSIFQGIQGGLIDAITLISTETQKLCPMRVVMALTSGYFINQMPDTVFTRTYRVFDLDVQDKFQASFKPTEFAARYLNAVRVGSADLDAAHARGDEFANACEQCPVNTACHSAFGAVNGYGLFPFNATALDRAILSQSGDASFVARDVLTRVLRPVLQRDQTEIDAGQFPSEGFATDFKTGGDGLLASIEDQIKLQTPGDDELSQRRVRLIRFWGSGDGAENLASTIHEAFDVAPIADLSTELPSEEVLPPETGLTLTLTPPAAKPASVDPPLVKAVDRWHATGEIGQTDRNNLRNIVYNAVQQRVPFEDGYGGYGLWGNDKALAPGFEATSVEFNQSKLTEAVLPIDRSSADDIRALRGLAFANRTGSWVDVPDGERLHRIAETRIQKWVDLVSTALLPPVRPEDDAELIKLASALLTMARALGVPDAFKTDAASKVRALFASPPPRQDLGTRPGLRMLHTFLLDGTGSRLNRAQLQQRLLRHASYSQGAGKPLALDLSKMNKVVRNEGTEMAWPESTPELVKSTVSSVQVRIASIDALHHEATDVVPNLTNIGADVVNAAADLLVLVNERAAAGALPGGISPADLQAAAKAIKPGDQRRVEIALEELSQWGKLSTDERLQVLNGDWDEPARRVSAWLKLATHTVRLLENSLRNGTASRVEREYAEARDQLVENLTMMADTIAGVSGPASESEDVA